MLMVTVILMLVASVALSAALCFVKKHSPFLVVLKCFFFASLMCVGICCASYRNAFNGLSILLFLSVLPLFFTLFELGNKENEENFSVNQTSETFQNDVQNNNTQFQQYDNTQNFNDNPQNFDENIVNNEYYSQNAKQHNVLAPNWTRILKGTAYAVSAFCVAFCALYLGKETFFSFLVGLALGLALTFLHFIIKKRSLLSDPWGFCADFLSFLAVGFLISAILPTLLYSFALDNILFSAACLTFSAHILLEIYLPNRFNHIALALSYFVLFATIIF